MGKLSDRLDRFKEAQESIKTHMELVERYNQSVPKLEYLYSLIEGDNVMKQRKYAERQSIKAALQLYERSCEGLFHTERFMEDMLTNYDMFNFTNDDVVPMLSSDEVRDRQYRDVVENFLYTEWLESDIQTFSHFCVYVGLKAFVNLVTRHQDSLKALLELGIYIPDDLRNRCVLFKERLDYQPDDPMWYTTNVLVDIPEAWGVSQELLIHYSDQARLEKVSTPLPDNPFLDEVDSERARIRQGINAYVAREGSVKDISKKYGLTRRQLEDELRSAGLLRRHGGKRR